MAVLGGMHTIQYLARRAWLSVHKLFTSCIERCLAPRACNWVKSTLYAVLLIYSFQFRPAFFHVGKPGGTAVYLVYPISDIGRRRKFGEVSCTERIGQRNHFELIPTVKIKTRHPPERSFGSEFPWIYNHCGVMAAWNRKMLNISKEFCVPDFIQIGSLSAES